MVSDHNHQQWKKGDRIMIADCFHAETAEVRAIKYNNHKQLIQFAEPLTFMYRDIAYVGQFMKEVFYLESIKNKHLFKYHLNRSEVLTESIEKFELINTSNKLITILIRFKHDKTDYKIQTAHRS